MRGRLATEHCLAVAVATTTVCAFAFLLGSWVNGVFVSIASAL